MTIDDRKKKTLYICYKSLISLAKKKTATAFCAPQPLRTLFRLKLSKMPDAKEKGNKFWSLEKAQLADKSTKRYLNIGLVSSSSSTSLGSLSNKTYFNLKTAKLIVHFT